MSEQQRLHIDIDLDRAGAVPEGTISTADTAPASFAGWLGFLSALERAMGVDGETPGDSPAQTG